MNGRVYEPTLGRFLSADPVVQNPDSTQGLNRYTYANNNPLSFTDPSGFFSIGKIFKAIGNAIGNIVGGIAKVAKKALQNQFVQIAGQIVLGSIGGPPGLYAAAAFSGISTLANGGNLGDALLSAGTTYAFIQVTGGIGKVFGHNASFLSPDHFGKIVAHGVAGGAFAELRGGKFKSGFLSGSVTAFGAPLVGEIGGKGMDGVIGRTAVSAVIGGASAELGGGKFANGAVTAAFGRLYTEFARAPQGGRLLAENEKIEARRAFGNAINYDAVKIYGQRWFPLQGDNFAMAPDGNIYWPGAAACTDLTVCSITVDGGNDSTLPTFIHEMAHVMQFQNGINVIGEALPIQVGRMLTGRMNTWYLSPSAFLSTPSPSGINVEAQADWYRHNYCATSQRC